MIKKSLALLTLTAVSVQGKDYGFFEEWTKPRNLMTTYCTDAT